MIMVSIQEKQGFKAKYSDFREILRVFSESNLLENAA
jgi:hypothetical protein